MKGVVYLAVLFGSDVEEESRCDWAECNASSSRSGDSSLKKKKLPGGAVLLFGGGGFFGDDDEEKKLDTITVLHGTVEWRVGGTIRPLSSTSIFLQTKLSVLCSAIVVIYTKDKL